MSASGILVTGATGSIGGALVDLLERDDRLFTVLCRRPEQAEKFRARGIRAALGDFGDRDSLRAAVAGHEQLFLLPPGGGEGSEQYQRDVNAIDAASAAGVRHVVKISASDANPQSSVPWARDHGRSDEYLRASGLAWTRLKPPAFMTNLFGMAPLIRHGLLPNPSGHGACTWVDPVDVAAAAHAVLVDPTHRGGTGEHGRTYLLTGTQPLSFPQIAGVMTATLDHAVRPVPVPAPLLYAGIRLGGGPHWQARGMVAQFHDVVRRGLDGVRVFSTELADLIGRAPTDMTEFVAANAAKFA